MLYLIQMVEFKHGDISHVYDFRHLPDIVTQYASKDLLEMIVEKERSLGSTIDHLIGILIKEVSG